MHLTAEKLGVRRGGDLLFCDISFDLGPGDALVLTGRNGTGKSTLLRLVAGLLCPDFGRIMLRELDGPSERRPAEVSHYLGHRNAMKQELTVAENLGFWKAYLGDTDGGAGLSVEAAADAVGLDGITHLPYGYLSAGQQRRFAFAKLLVAHRPIWILDEPTAALDAGADRLFADLITAHRNNAGIVLAATHQPLGLVNARELRMAGFAGVGAEVWG